MAVAVGAITFLIWYGTAGSRTTGPEEAAGPRGPALPTPSNQESELPRGGSLTGSIQEGDEREAIRLLTQATLVRINRSTDQVEPWLAESWTASNDNLTYTFKLRPNILWPDGRPLVAGDVAAALASSGSAVRALDPLQVEITFPEPFAPALRALDNVPIVSQRNVRDGLGPFLVAVDALKASGRKYVAFERNPHYWRNAPDGKPLPYLDGLVLNVIPDQNAELQQLLSGQLDFIQNDVRPEDYVTLERADQSGKIRLYHLEAGLEADALWFSVSPSASANEEQRGWLRQDDFRLAVSAAVNRRAFCDAVYLDACDPIWSPVTPGNPAWFNPDLPAAGADQALARAMLAGIGLQDRNADGILDDEKGRPVRFTMLVRRGSARDGLGARFVRDELRTVGIAAEIAAVEPDALNARRLAGDYDAVYSRLVPIDTDPAVNLDFWLRWESTDWGKKMADVMRRQASTADRVQRAQLFADAQKIYVQHMPAVFFGAPYAYVATSPRVLNAKPSRQRPSLLWNAEILAAAAR